MFRRVAFFCLGLWLIAAGALSAAAAPCPMQAMPEMASPAATARHCDMAAMPTPPAPRDMPDGACCCPAILAALPAPDVPGAAVRHFTLPVAIAAPLAPASRNLVPEPPPPKA